MALMVIQHKVRDYAEWRPAYDAHEPSRVAAGITNGRVYRKAEDPNDLVILLDVADVAKARSWAASEDLKTAMQNAGVVRRSCNLHHGLISSRPAEAQRGEADGTQSLQTQPADRIEPKRHKRN